MLFENLGEEVYKFTRGSFQLNTTHLGFSEIQAVITNLPILPNFLPNLPNQANLPILPSFVKIKNPLKILKLKISNFISF